MVKETPAARRCSSQATKNTAPARHKHCDDPARAYKKQGAGAKTRKGGAAAAPTTTALSAVPPAPSALAAAAAEPAAAPAAPALDAVPPAPAELAAAAAVPAAAPALGAVPPAPAAPALGAVPPAPAAPALGAVPPAPSALAAAAAVPAAAPAAPALGAALQDATVQDAAEDDMSLEEAEARMMMPLSEDEIKERSERRKASKMASKRRKHVQAVELSESDEAGFPMPLTIAEANLLVISSGHEAKSKNALLSEIMSKHEVNQRRFRTLSSRPEELKLCCVQPGCDFSCSASFYRRDDGTPAPPHTPSKHPPSFTHHCTSHSSL